MTVDAAPPRLQSEMLRYVDGSEHVPVHSHLPSLAHRVSLAEAFEELQPRTMPGIYVRQAMAAEQSAPAAIGNITAPPANDDEPGSVVTQHAAPSVVTQHAAPDQFLSHANMLPAARWAECIKVAPPRQRNHTEMKQAYEDFKRRFDNSGDQRSQDQTHGP